MHSEVVSPVDSPVPPQLEESVLLLFTTFGGSMEGPATINLQPQIRITVDTWTNLQDEISSVSRKKFRGCKNTFRKFKRREGKDGSREEAWERSSV